MADRLFSWINDGIDDCWVRVIVFLLIIMAFGIAAILSIPFAAIGHVWKRVRDG